MANSTDSSVTKDAPVQHAQTKQDPSPLDLSMRDQLPSPAQPVSTLSRLLKGKEREWEIVHMKRRPLHLLDLPVDILRLVVKEITHTNDLTALALTNSTLYNLAIPQIYQRFDIVWPDSTMTTSDSKNVDALTYGLATLCLGSKFAQKKRWLQSGPMSDESASLRLIDNQYAKHTRKFSLGNGPADWVAEYNIKTRESGKMLGTLVALAVSKMVNLETFVWDMPTGVLSDVFMALASLGDRNPNGKSKLERVWIRWHDNSDVNGTVSSVSSPAVQPAVPAMPTAPPPVGTTNLVPVPNATGPAPVQPLKYAESHVEYPTFSVLPALTSLTVLDIDELAYLDEMSVLIERSKDTLQELRVGISQKASTLDFVGNWEGANLKQVDFTARWPGENHIGDKRLGGVLGVLVGRIYEIRQKGRSKSKRALSASSIRPSDQANVPVDSVAADLGANPAVASHPPFRPTSEPINHQRRHEEPLSQTSAVVNEAQTAKTRLDGKLRLHTLELERVSLSMQVCCKAFDWSTLTNLTILDCVNHETLWRVLRKHFQPTPPPHGLKSGTPVQYHLALKKIHTDMTTHALMAFIKDTLAPNTLEVLFLQDRRRGAPPVVTIEQIFRGAIKRHHASLKKILIDSTDKLGRNSSSEGSRWRSWVIPTEMISYITSGRMMNLRELAVAFHYKDWHHFLQRLPNIPQLRSLYVPHVQEYIAGSFEPKELALQLVDIITLRPEVQLCYVGIASKCFEILETTSAMGNPSSDPAVNSHHHHHQVTAVDAQDEDEDPNDNQHSEQEDTEDDGDGDDAGTDASSNTDSEDDLTEVSDDGASEGDLWQEPEHIHGGTRLRLREILFYDDKVAIFRARHGKL